MTRFLQHKPRVVEIVSVKNETPSVRSLNFRDELSSEAKPGQFIMTWVPGADEIPLSLTPFDKDGLVRIAVKERGEGSKALLRRTKGDMMGIRGPYGSAFTHANEQSVLMIAGGTGTIPLLALLRALVPEGIECNFILGAGTARELLFATEIRSLAAKTRGSVRVATEDGSDGAKGLATDIAAKVLKDHSFDRVYTCGPEAMMKRVIDLAQTAQTPVEAGLERIFKCGSGICGSCCIGPHLVCKDGPVFNGEILRGLPEFGLWARDHSGRRVAIGLR